MAGLTSHAYFTSNWACSTSLSYDSSPTLDVAGKSLLYNHDWNTNTKTAAAEELLPEKDPQRSDLVWDSNHLCVNSSSVEDTDLYFMCKEFPPPSYLSSLFETSTDLDREIEALHSARKSSYVLHYEGCWHPSTKGAQFKPLNKFEILQHGNSFPLLLNIEQQQRDQSWEQLEDELRNYYRREGAHRRVVRTSTHERLELVLRGHTKRLPSRLFLSMNSVELMKLSLVPNARWYIYDRNAHDGLRKSQRTVPSRKKKGTSVRKDDHSLPEISSAKQYSLTLDELHLLGGGGKI